jgi:hypothetical protein
MIDPKDFVKTAEIVDPGIRVSGNFACQTCDKHADHARLDEDEMMLTYVCSDNHENEAKL